MILDRENGETLNPSQIDEAKLWIRLIEVLSNGIVKPYDASFVIDKLSKVEKKHDLDLTELKNCCPSEGTIREALIFKPYIDAALVEIENVTGLQVKKATIWK